MDYYTLIFAVCFACCVKISPGKAEKDLKHPQENTLDKLWKDVMRSNPTNEANSLIPQVLGGRWKVLRRKTRQNIAEEKKRIHPKVLPLEEEVPTKKSTKPLTPNSQVALKIALMKSNVYLTSKTRGNNIEPEMLQEYTSKKRFYIPQTEAETQTQKKSDSSSVKLLQPKSKALVSKQTMFSEGSPMFSEDKPMLTVDPLKFSNGRTKRQDDTLMQRLYTARSVADDPSRTYSIRQFNALIPETRFGDGEINMRSDVYGMNENKVMAVLPLKMTAPVVMSPARSIALGTVDVPSISSVQGTERSTFPIRTLMKPVHRQLFETANLMVSPQVEDVLVKLPKNENYVTTAEQQQHGGASFMAQPEQEGPVIKLAHVPVDVLNSETRKTEGNKKKTETEKEPIYDDKKENILKSIQLTLSSFISKLEEKVNQERRNKKAKTANIKKAGKPAASEKSLKVLKHKFSRMLAKFKSKPTVGQPFEIGKEWSHLLGTGVNKDHQKGELSKKGIPGSSLAKGESKENEGNWPSIASQLLRKLNKALAKLQERKVVRALAKNAVMYFSFDNAKPSQNFEALIPDKSGHFNDATISNRAHISSRTYGSCGKGLILNSGNLRYVDKYFKNEPTKAITLAMWVRTNATGYVRWFARDTGYSREFSTVTQYPLVRKNVWTHLCGTFNTSTGTTRIYVDGELKAERVNKQENTVPADFTPVGIGSKFGDNNLIAVDEVYIFAKALSENEVQALYDDCEFNRMVLHYGFQKVNRTSGVIFDQSGLNNDAEIRGDAKILDSGCDKCGSCLDLNTKDDPRLAIRGAQFKHRPTKAISLAAWLNLNSTTGTHPLFKVTESVTKAPLLDLHVTDGKLTWKARDKDQNTIFNLITKQSVVPEGIWVYVLGTYDSVRGSAKIFVDGHQKAFAKTAIKVPVGEDWGEILVGGRSIGSQILGGYLDELVMYNWELDPSEISYVMKYCPDHPKLVSFTVHIPLE